MCHFSERAAPLPWQQRLLPSPLCCLNADSQLAVAHEDYALFPGMLAQTAYSRDHQHRRLPTAIGCPVLGISVVPVRRIPGLLLWQSLAGEARSVRVSAFAELRLHFQSNRLAHKGCSEHKCKDLSRNQYCRGHTPPTL